MSAGRITDESASYLGALVRLEDLNLCHYNGLTDVGIRHLGSLTSLTHLNLDLCEEVTDVGFLRLKEMLQSKPLVVSHHRLF